jgi:hypothetical protein
MNKKDQFLKSGLELLKYRSKQDLIENLFIKEIHETYWRIDKNIGTENDIRDRFIYDFYHGRSRLRDLINDNILFVNLERWVFKNKSDLGRTDLSFAISGFEFIVECKRLKNASPQYIKEGLSRFINKDYSKNESYAGMMGFVVSGDIESICSVLKDKCHQESYCESDFVRSKTGKNDKYFVTSHHREGANAINIYHLFFEFSQSLLSPNNL